MDELLVDREAELSAVEAAAARAGAGQGALVLIEGPWGSGLSALLRAGIALAREGGMVVLHARAVAADRGARHAVAVRLLRDRLAAAAPAERARLLAGDAALAGPLFDGRPAAGVGAAHGIAALLGNLARSAPLALAIDDLHWADAQTLRTLHVLTSTLAELPVLVLLAHHGGEPGAPTAALHALRERADVLSLAALGPAGVAQIVRAALPAPHATAAACDAYARASGGNPFVLHELIRAAATAPEAAATVEQLGVPPSLQRATEARLARFPPAVAALAGAVAVLGAGASMRQAVAVAGVDGAAAEAAADALADAVILRPGEPLEFAQPAVGAAVRDGLGAFARARLHRRAADVLRRDGAAPEAIVAHLMAASPEGDEWAAETLRAAGARLSSNGRPDAAVRLLERALAEPPPDTARRPIQRELALAAASNGSPGAAARLRDVIDGSEEPRERATLLARLSRLLYVHGDFGGAAASAAEGLALAPTDDEQLRHELRAAHLSAASLDPAQRGAALATMRELADRARAGDVPAPPFLPGIVLYLAGRSEPADLVRTLADLAIAAEPNVVPGPDGTAIATVAAALVAVDELEHADYATEIALRRAHAGGLRLAMSIAHQWRAFVLCHMGRLADAEEAALRGLEMLADGWTAHAGVAAAALVTVRLERGELDAARDALGIGAPATGSQPLLLHARARVALAEDRPGPALEAARAIGDVLGRHHGLTNPGIVPWSSTAALALHALGERSEAVRLAREELSLARRAGGRRALGVALRTTGTLVGGADGLALLEEASAVLAGSASVLERARAQVELGAALRRAGRRTSARAPLRAAFAFAEEAGAKTLAARAHEELLSAGARPRRAALRGVESLTPRERHVGALAAAGRSNQQIASALFLSPRTVEWHLGSAFRKLGLSSRAELAGALEEVALPLP